MVLATFPLESSARVHAAIPARSLAPQAPIPLQPVSAGADFGAPRSSLIRIWDGLVEGRLRITDHRVDEASVSLFLTSQPPNGRQPASEFKIEILAGALTGRAQKETALDRRLTPSTVSLWIASVMRDMGLACCLRHAPLGLAMLASARALGQCGWFPGYHVIPSITVPSLELRMPRPDSTLRERLTPSEYEVLREAIAGSSHKEIGAQRGRSPRTVANQLRSVGSKLGVSGRFQWTHLAVMLSAGVEACEPPTLSSVRPPPPP